MHFDLYEWIHDPFFSAQMPMSDQDIIEEATWNWMHREDWVPTPALFFAMKQVIREQMMGG